MFHTLFIALCGRQTESDGPIQEENAPDDDRERAPGQSVDLRLQLGADDREASERAVDQVLAQLVVVTQDIAKDGREQHQKGEDGEQAVIGNQRCLATGLVVPELLAGPRRETRAHRVVAGTCPPRRTTASARPGRRLDCGAGGFVEVLSLGVSRRLFREGHDVPR